MKSNREGPPITLLFFHGQRMKTFSSIGSEMDEREREEKMRLGKCDVDGFWKLPKATQEIVSIINRKTLLGCLEIFLMKFMH